MYHPPGGFGGLSRHHPPQPGGAGLRLPPGKDLCKAPSLFGKPGPCRFCGGAWGRGGGLPPPGGVRRPLCRPHGKRAGHRRLQRLPPPGGGEGPPRRRGSLGPLPGRGGNAPCLRRIQEGRPRLLRKPGVYGQQAPAELQKEPHTRGAVTASLFSPGNNRNPRGFYEENVKNQKF